MIYTISNEDIFQVLSSSFSIGPSETGYELQVGADSRSFTTLFSVGANTPRMVTNVANGSYFRLKNNTGNVKVNWERVCSDDSGGGFDPSVLEPYWTSAQTKDYVDEAVSGISLDGYWTSAQTQSAITIVEDHLYDVEQVTASALTELHEGLMEVSGRSVDLSGYYTSAQTEDAISAATSGKADAANLSTGDTNPGDFWFPKWNEQGIITGKTGLRNFQIRFDINGIRNRVTSPDNGYIPSIWAPTTSGNPGEILVSTGGGAPVWSAMTFPTPDVDKAYVDSAITGVQDQIDVMDEVIPAALVDLNDRIVELSGSSVDLSAYYTSAQTEDAISAATSGKADAVNITANTNKLYFPKWNKQGIVVGWTLSEMYNRELRVNGDAKSYITQNNRGNLAFYAPTTSGNPGDILVSNGNGAPVWTTDNKVSSTSVSTIWKGTQAEYDAIATKDPATLYIIL